MKNITKLIFFVTLVLCSLRCLVQADTPFIGEIYVFPYDHLAIHSSPGGFYCNGQLLPISQYTTLFSLLGTVYGGDGETTFALPNLMGRTPVGLGNSDLGTIYNLGQTGGSNSVSLSTSHIPGYSSALLSGKLVSPLNETCQGGTPTLAQADNVCSSEVGTSEPVTFTPQSAHAPRENRMKSVPLYFAIFYEGIYPSRDRNANEPELVQEEEREVEVAEKREEKEEEKREEEEEGHKVTSRGDEDGIAFIEILSFDWAPKYFAKCANQLLSIAQNTALFSLLGTYYGGNGQTTFGLPDLQGRIPSCSNNFQLGSKFGSEAITLDQTNIPSYNSDVSFTAVSSNSPRYCASTPKAFVAKNMCSPATSSTQIDVATDPTAQPHPNLQPYLVLNYVISIQGIYPARSKRGYGQPYLGQMMIFAGNFAPVNFMFCFGQILAIDMYDALFQKIGTTFGGDGETTFALPDMRDAIPIGVGTNPESGVTYNLGVTTGINSVTLTSSNVPVAGRTGTLPVFQQKAPGTNCSPNTKNAFQQNTICSDDTFTVHATAVNSGAAQPIDITKPVQWVNWIIAVAGVY